MDKYSLEEFKVIIQKNKVFRPLSVDDLKNIYSNSQVIHIKRERHVFEEGARLSGIYYILSGLIKLYKIGAKGRVQIFHFYKAGNIFGYDSLMNFQTTCTAAMAIEEVELIYISNKAMTSVLMENNELRVCMMQLACRELKVAQESILDLTQKFLKQRIIDFLLFLEDNYGLDKNNMIDISLDREDFAHTIGCTMESIIRIISELRREKVIVTHGKKIGILKMKELKYLSISN
jgi:CRP/FNR family transcriptional regulator, polysaccharide utilization system transcription regulator